jgi:predicted transcriptional regulator
MIKFTSRGEKMTTLTLEISDTLDEKVADVAKRSKLSKEQLAEKVLEDFIERDISENGTDKENWLEDFDEWMDSLDSDTPSLTDEQISRESIYEEQIKRQL